MNPEELVARLVEARPPDAALLDEAAAVPECVPLLLDRARQATPTDPNDARRTARLAVELARRRQDGRAEAQAWRIEGQTWRVQGRHYEALDVFRYAAEAAERAGDELLAAQVQIGRIDSLVWTGAYTEALALAERLEAILRAGGAESDAAKVLVNAGTLHFRRDQYARAQACYERAEATFAETGDDLSRAVVQVNLANVLTHLNRVEEALNRYAQARATLTDAEREREVAVIDLNVGHLHQVSGRYTAALATLSQARETFARLEQEHEQANADLAQGDIYSALNLLPEAQAQYARALPVYERLGLDFEIAETQRGQAILQAAEGRYDDAFATLEEAGEHFRRKRNTVQQAHIRLIRAGLLYAQGQSAEASAEAHPAARTFARRRLHGWAAEARFLAAANATDGIPTLHAVARTGARHARGWLTCRAYHEIGKRHAAQGRSRLALRYFRAAVGALEEARTQIAPEEMHVAFLRDKQAIYESAVAALLERGGTRRIAEALELVERAKSRLLLERVQSALEGQTPSGRASAPQRERLAALRAELSRAYHRLNALDEHDRQRLAGSGLTECEALVPLEREYRAALRESEQAADVGPLTLGRVVTTEALQATLGSEETLLEYYIVGGMVGAFVVTQKRIRFCPGLASLAEVQHAARRMRYHLPRAGLPETYAARHAGAMLASTISALQSLYDLLLRPLLRLLKTERIILVPHGPLHGLPFHAFHEGVTYALDRWEFVYTPSASFWHTRAAQCVERKTASGTDGGLLLMGVPAPGLARIASEVQQLARLWPETRLLEAEQATVAAFHDHAPQSRRIHLATHALFRSDKIG